MTCRDIGESVSERTVQLLLVESLGSQLLEAELGSSSHQELSAVLAPLTGPAFLLNPRPSTRVCL